MSQPYISLEDSLKEIASIITKPDFAEFIRSELKVDEKTHFRITARNQGVNGDIVVSFDHEEQTHKRTLRLFTKVTP
jgi:hypothetical protein